MLKHFGPQLIFLAFLSLFLELVLLPDVAFYGARPDLFFILIVFYSIYIQPSRTLQFSIFLGVLRDLFSASFFGFEILAYGISGLALWLAVMKVQRDNLLNQLGLLFLYSFINLLIFSVLSISLSHAAFTILQAFTKIVLVSAYTCLAAPIVFWMMRVYLKISQKDLFGRPMPHPTSMRP